MTIALFRDRRRLGRSTIGGSRATRPGSTRDERTGLVNRLAFERVGAHVLRRASRLGEPTGLVLLVVADAAEDPTSDPLLLASRILAEESRGEDLIARTGPFELSSLLPGAGEDDTSSFATRLGTILGVPEALQPEGLVPEALQPEADQAEALGPEARWPVATGIGWSVASGEDPEVSADLHELLRVARARA